jgi:hypothetical protein
VLWGFEVAAEDGDAVLVDATKFFLSDVHGVAAAIANAKQGKYKVEPTRSAIYLPRTKNFPENTDIESTLTFVGEEPGNFVKQVTPEPHAINCSRTYFLHSDARTRIPHSRLRSAFRLFWHPLYGFCRSCG